MCRSMWANPDDAYGGSAAIDRIVWAFRNETVSEILRGLMCLYAHDTCVGIIVYEPWCFVKGLG